MEDLIRVRNIHNKVWKDSYGGREYIIPPDGEREIPRAAYWLWFGGHPADRDQERGKREARERRGQLGVEGEEHHVFDVWPCLEILREETISYEEMVEKYEKSPVPEDAPEPEPEFPGLDKVLPPKGKKK